MQVLIVTLFGRICGHGKKTYALAKIAKPAKKNMYENEIVRRLMKIRYRFIEAAIAL